LTKYTELTLAKIAFEKKQMVKLFNSQSLTPSSEGADTADHFNKNMIKKVSLNHCDVFEKDCDEWNYGWWLIVNG